MIKLLFIVLIIYVLLISDRARFCFTHPVLVISHFLVDARKYIKYKRWNECKTWGCMNVYIADERQPFGSGKTLNMVAQAFNIYQKFNNKDVFNFSTFEWVKQYVHVYSNIELYGIPYIPLTNSYQLVNVCLNDDVVDNNFHVYIFIFDELGTIFNNRDWKNNLSPDLIAAMFQQRKHHVLILGTVQNFSLFDATLRKICTSVYVCSKFWRLLSLRHYYATDLERANFNTELIDCRSRFVRFASDGLYHSYNTNEAVLKLEKSIVSGDHLSNEEILKLSENNQDTRTLTHVARRFRKHVRG